MPGDERRPIDLDVVFGPVPSRRLGRSLGIDHVPPKTCSYACVYCQLGSAMTMQARRTAFYPPDEVVAAVAARVATLERSGEAVDFLTFVPAGETTLDANLGHEIRALRPLGIPIAVITNASLIAQEGVRHDLAEADWVSLKVDAVEAPTWRAINRPQRDLDLEAIRQGARAFAREFRGTLVTETMLVAGINDDAEQLTAVAGFLAELAPRTAYLSIPSRPPALRGVRPPDEPTLNRAYQLFSQHLAQVECLLGYEGNAFSSTGDAEHDLLSITAVHPMREDAVMELLARTGTDAGVLQRLVDEGRLVAAVHGGRTFYVRRVRRPRPT